MIHMQSARNIRVCTTFVFVYTDQMNRLAMLFGEQSRQRAVWTGIVLLLGLTAFSEREQRALLLGTSPNASAFTSITPGAPASGGSAGGLEAGGNRTGRSNGVRSRTGGATAAPGAPTEQAQLANSPGATIGGSPTIATDPTQIAAADEVAPGAAAGSTPGRNFISTPSAGEQSAASAGAGSVPAVPEAPTWAMLILGVAAVGCALRRQRASRALQISIA